MDETVSQTKKAVSEVTNLAQSLQEGAGPQIDLALNEAQTLIDKIKESLPNKNDKSKDELDRSVELRTNMTLVVVPLQTLDESLKALKNKTKTFENNILDINNYTNIAKDKAEQTSLINDANRLVFYI